MVNKSQLFAILIWFFLFQLYVAVDKLSSFAIFSSVCGGYVWVWSNLVGAFKNTFDELGFTHTHIPGLGSLELITAAYWNILLVRWTISTYCIINNCTLNQLYFQYPLIMLILGKGHWESAAVTMVVVSNWHAYQNIFFFLWPTKTQLTAHN